MAWDEQRNLARYEVVWRGDDERSHHAAVAERAERAGMSVTSYIKAVLKAVINRETGDPILESLLNVTSDTIEQRLVQLETRIAQLEAHGPPPIPHTAPSAGVDSLLDQMGL
jgi:hypothetical protein